MKEMTKKEAKIITGGGLTKNSKINAPTYNVSAWECKTGSIMAKITGKDSNGKPIVGATPSICSTCYSRKGRAAMYRAKFEAGYKARLESFKHPQWSQAFATLTADQPYIRLYSSGDLDSVESLEKIVYAAELTPTTLYWLPTRERGIIRAFLADGGIIPDNLTIRLSATLFDTPADSMGGRFVTSTSHDKAAPIEGSFECKAPSQGGACLDCRACWNGTVKNISYKRH